MLRVTSEVVGGVVVISKPAGGDLLSVERLLDERLPLHMLSGGRLRPSIGE